jgi:hypothetical protein
MARKRHPIKIELESEPEHQSIMQLWLLENPSKTRVDWDRFISLLGAGKIPIRGIRKIRPTSPQVRNGMLVREMLVYSLRKQ